MILLPTFKSIPTVELLPSIINCHDRMRKVKKTEGEQHVSDVLGQDIDQMTLWHAILLEKVDKIIHNIIRQDCLW